MTPASRPDEPGATGPTDDEPSGAPEDERAGAPTGGPGGAGPDPAEGELDYECAEWSEESRRLLASLLVSSGLAHAWQGTTVSVRPADEERVDALVDEVLAAAGVALEADGPRTVYEVGGWPVVLLTELTEGLAAAGIPYEWDAAGDLVVEEADEDRVEEVLAGLPDPEEGELSADDGLAVHDLLDRLFRAADRLARRPGDPAAIVEVDSSVPQLAALSPPFGFEPVQWRALVEPARELRDLLSGADASAVDDGDVAALAASVRDRLRACL